MNSADSATIPIRSLGGVPFKVFAKTRLWNAVCSHALLHGHRLT